MELAELFVTLALDASEYTKELAATAKDTASWASGIGKAITVGIAAAATLAAAAIAGIGVAALSVANDADVATKNIQAQLGLTASEAERLGDVALAVFGNNFAGSVTEAGAALVTIQQTMGRMAGDEMQQVAESAFTIADAFDQDVNEVISASAVIMENFGVTSEESMDLIATGFQIGLDGSDDFLDSIGEYSTQFNAGGATAKQFFSTMSSGFQLGLNGTDKAADAFKEFRVRIQDGSDLTADSLTALGIDADAVLASLADGSIEAIDVWEDVGFALANADDGALRMQAGVGLLGTQFEDLGIGAIDVFETMDDRFHGLDGTVEGLGVQYTTLGGLAGAAFRKIQVAIKPIGDILLTLGQTVLPIFTNAITKATETFTPIAETVADLFENVISGGGIENTISLFSELSFLFDDLASSGGIFGTIFGGLSAITGDISEQLASGDGVSLFDAILSIVPQLQEAITTITNLTTSIKTGFQWVMDNGLVIAGIIGGIVTTIASFTILTTIAGFVTTFIAVMSSLVAAFSSVVAGGTAIASTIGAIVAVMGGPLTIAIALISAAIGFLAFAWTTNFLGIRDTLLSVWNEYLMPAFTAIQLWLSVNIPLAIAALVNIWQTVLIPAFNSLVAIWNDTLKPALIELAQWFAVAILLAIKAAMITWNTILKPAIIWLATFVTDQVIPTLTSLGEQLGTILVLALGFLLDALDFVLDKLDIMWLFIKDNVIPIFKDIWTEISEKLTPIFDGLASGISTAKDALSPFVTLLTDLKTAVAALDLTAIWALIGQSPSPLAIGIMSANDAIQQMSSAVLPKLNAEFDVIGNSLNKNLGAMADVGGGGNTSNFNTSIISNQPAGQLVRASRFEDRLMAL